MICIFTAVIAAGRGEEKEEDLDKKRVGVKSGRRGQPV